MSMREALRQMWHAGWLAMHVVIGETPTGY